jgi:hypothetical protein
LKYLSRRVEAPLARSLSALPLYVTDDWDGKDKADHEARGKRRSSHK